LGPGGERWVPLHGVFAHEDVVPFHHALQRFYADRAEDMKRHGVWGGGMYSTVGSSGFLYEIALYWPDEQTAYHREYVPADYLAQLPKFPADPAAREFVHRLKGELVELYDRSGAVHFQLGRAYPYAPRLQQPAARLAGAIKSALDPQRVIGPGVLGL